MSASEAEVLAEVHLSYLVIGDDGVGTAFGQYATGVEDIGVIADSQRLPNVVVGDEHADAQAGQVLDDFLDLDHRNRVDSGEWLVEQDEAGARR